MADPADNLSTGVDNPEDIDLDTIAVDDDFFLELDKSVNSIEYSKEKETPKERSEKVVTEPEKKASPDESSDDIETLQKRYSDSSKEAKRLNKQLQDVEPYLPILNALKDDPNLRNYVRGYYEEGGDTPKSIKEDLKLSEDFVFDGDEAISDPTSDSARVLNATVDARVSSALGEYAQQQSAATRQMAEENRFKSQNEISDDEWSELQDFARNHTLTYDDILYLKNKEARGDKIADSERNSMLNQMDNVRKRPTSLSSTRSKPVEVDADQAVFNAIKGVEEDIEDLFSIEG